MLSAEAIVELHDRQTRAWHAQEGGASDCGEPNRADGAGRTVEEVWLQAVCRQHRANFDLWHIEDEARTPGASDAELAAVKRRIDQTNQCRNDLAEELDRALLAWLEPRQLPNPEAQLHSESPGLVVDRLSILALKIYHTREEVARGEAGRADAPPGHKDRNRQRLRILEEQRADLTACLDHLWRETLAGSRRFKLYRQLKMYNDPTLNPAVYGKAEAARRP